MAAAAGAMRKLSRDDPRWHELAEAMRQMQRDADAQARAPWQPVVVKRRKRIVRGQRTP